MQTVHHLTFALMGPMAHTKSHRTPCHCLVLRDGDRVALVDSGFGTQEMEHPTELLGADFLYHLAPLVDMRLTAVYQLRQLGIDPGAVTDIVLTHLDNDHAGGLHDFPNATVHLSQQELSNYDSTRPRGPYKPYQVSHATKFKTYEITSAEWFGIFSAALPVMTAFDLHLVPLPGHTLGQCGVAYRQGGKWWLHAADAYFDRTLHLDGEGREIPLELAFQTDATQRRETLRQLRRLHRDHSGEVEIFSTHDQHEFEELAAGDSESKRIATEILGPLAAVEDSQFVHA